MDARDGKGRPTQNTRTLSQCLGLIEGYLAQPGDRSTDAVKHYYVCVAAKNAVRDGVINQLEAEIILSVLMTKICHYSTLAAWLHANKQLPEHLKQVTGGYDVRHPDYLRLRNNFLFDLHNELHKLEVDDAIRKFERTFFS